MRRLETLTSSNDFSTLEKSKKITRILVSYAVMVLENSANWIVYLGEGLLYTLIHKNFAGNCQSTPLMKKHS